MAEQRPENFDRYAEYYGLISQWKDYRAGVDYLEKPISHYTKDTLSILELGLGTKLSGPKNM